jgi:ABC-type multidrug transport system fused ATPase/permease subunit
MHPVPVIDHLNLVIQENTTVALVGSTGSGKTTIIDILLGLLRPSSGHLLVNNVEVESDKVKAWQNNLGYVPQHIYLSDDTIARNIAFGVPEKEIDFDALVHAATTANLHEFIVHELTNGYQTMVGERGIRLSGGQRQRIGIARSLYHNPSMIILDEATSALDGETESIVMSAIQNLSHKLTIVMVAHRLNTVKHCDTIHVIQEGSVVSSGTFSELSRSCEYFRRLKNTPEQCQDDNSVAQ